MTATSTASAPCFVSLDANAELVQGSERTPVSGETTVVSSRTLVELIGQGSLQAIQDAFAIAFDIPTVVLDHQGYNVNEITHRVAFCEDLTRPSRAGHQCLNCDRAGMRLSAASHRPTIFHCWNGLWDCTVPIVSSRGELFGYFLAGQVFFERQNDLDRYRGDATDHGIDPDAYVRAAEAVRVMPRGVYARGIECIGVLARMIADQASAALRHREMLDTLLAANAQTERLAAELDTIAKSVSQLGATGEGPATTSRLCDSIERVIDCDSLLIARLEQGGRLRPVVVRDPYADVLWEWRGRLGAGILGVVAETAQPMRVDDVASHPQFEPIPGLPIEAEALVAVPLELAGSVIGVLQLSRFERRTFTEHEFDLLRMLAGHIAVALGTANLRDQTRRYQTVASMHLEIWEALAAGESIGELCERVLGRAEALFSCSRAGVRVTSAEDGSEHVVTMHMSRRALLSCTRQQHEVVARARADVRTTVLDDGEEQLLICPVQGHSEPFGTLLMWRAEPFSVAERNLAQILVQQAGAAFEHGWRLRRERVLQGHARRLAELTEDAASATSREQVLASMLHAHELMGGTATALVLSGSTPGVLEVYTPQAGRPRLQNVTIAGQPELRFPAGSSSSDEPELFDAWAERLITYARAFDGPEKLVAVPLKRSAALLGALVVGGADVTDRAERALLRSLGTVAAAILENLEVRQPRVERGAEREAGLVALHTSALELLRLDDPGVVMTAICEEFCRLVGADGALLAQVRAGDRPTILARTALSRVDQKRLQELARRWVDEPAQVAGKKEVVAPIALDDGSTALVVSAGHRGEHDAAVVGTFANYAACALANARTVAAQRAESVRAKAEMRSHADQAQRLQHLVKLNTRIADAALARDGLERIVSTMHELGTGTVAVYDRNGRKLASQGDAPAILPELGTRSAIDAVLDSISGSATPILAEGEHLGWFAQLGDQTLECDAVALAAVGAAVTLLRERAAEEAEARVRGDLFDALVSSETLSEGVMRRGKALGHDLTQHARVAVARVDGLSGSELYPLAAAWAQRDAQLLLVERAAELVLIGPAEGRWAQALHELLAAEGQTRVGVGISTESESYRASVSRAERAVSALARLNRDGLLFIDGDGLEQLLLRVADPDRFATFIRSVLDPIEDYDSRRGSELRHTLELCIEHSWNLQATARVAHVHHSTLRYRLAKIGTLCNLDLQEPTGRLAVQLALLADRLLGAKVSAYPRR